MTLTNIVNSITPGFIQPQELGFANRADAWKKQKSQMVYLKNRFHRLYVSVNCLHCTKQNLQWFRAIKHHHCIATV